MIAEDDAHYAEYLRVLVQAFGFVVTDKVTTAEAALRSAEREPPDLVLMDMMMPELDGGDCANLFKERPELKDIPIVLLTATVKQSSDDEDTDGAGGLRYLAKPLNLRTLLACLDEYFGD